MHVDEHSEKRYAAVESPNSLPLAFASERPDPMNAVIREKYDAPVLTNEAIDLHVSYLRCRFDAMQARVSIWI